MSKHLRTTRKTLQKALSQIDWSTFWKEVIQNTEKEIDGHAAARAASRKLAYRGFV